MSTTKILMLALYRSQGEQLHPIRLAAVTDLSSFNYFTRGSVLEHLNFASRTVIQRTKAGTRQTVGLTENPFLVHTYVRYDGLAGIVVTQKDYQVRVAYSLINKVMTDYEAAYTPAAWKKANADVVLEPESMKRDILLYQNPAEADKLTMIQRNLDDIKDIMHKNIEEVLNRGETLDALMDKSEDLSATSLTFYKQAKKVSQPESHGSTDEAQCGIVTSF
jgi:synaptobrevin family protein YKT6